MMLRRNQAVRPLVAQLIKEDLLSVLAPNPGQRRKGILGCTYDRRFVKIASF